MAGRSFLLDVPATQKRTVLQNALVLPETTDGVIKRRYIRLTLKPNASQTNLLTALKWQMENSLKHSQFLKMRLLTY